MRGPSRTRRRWNEAQFNVGLPCYPMAMPRMLFELMLGEPVALAGKRFELGSVHSCLPGIAPRAGPAVARAPQRYDVTGGLTADMSQKAACWFRHMDNL